MARPVPIPNYPSNVPSMDSYTWRTVRGFKYDLNEGYNNAAMDILDWMFPSYAEFEGYRLNRDDLLDFSHIEGNSVVWENSGPVAYIVTGLVLMVVMIFAGISWCVVKYCCCCIRNRGSDYGDDASMVSKDDFTSKREKFARISCGVGLGIWILFFSFGLWGCFVANEQTRNAVRDLMKDIDKSLFDTQQYIDVTSHQINTVFDQSYDDFAAAYRKSWNCPSGNQQTASSNLTTMTNELKAASQMAAQLSHHFESVEETLTQSNANIFKIFEECDTGICQQAVQNRLQNLKFAPSFKNVKMALGSGISKSLDQGILTIKNAARIPCDGNFEQLITDVGEELKGSAKELTDAMSEIPLDKTREDIEEIDEEMQDWIPYMYGAILTACIILSLIPIVLAIGSFFGCLGSRSKRACGSRHRGGIFMNIGVFTMFLTAWIFWILCLAAFTFSGLLSQIVCEAVRDLENNYTVTTTTTRPFGVAGVHHVMKADGDYKLPNYADIMQRCKKHESAYSTFDLYTAFNVDEIYDTLENLPTRMNEIAKAKDESFFSDLAKLESELSRISANLITFDPNIIDTKELRQVAKHPEAIQIKTELELELSKLDDLNEQNVELLQSDVKLLDTHVQNALSLVSAASRSYEEQNKRIQNILEEGGPDRQVQAYADFVHDEITYHIGDCEPLYHALDTTIELFCYKIAQPVAAFWFSLQILLLLFIPLIITGILLDRLYRVR
jgi:hypothetical protein